MFILVEWAKRERRSAGDLDLGRSRSGRRVALL